MKRIEWNEAKNVILKSQRGICFEDVQTAMDEGDLLADIKHPNHKRYYKQRIFIVKLNNYAYLVPYVEDEDKIFLKTIIPNSKATRRYLSGGKNE
ncbi:MAG: BrnT family toxin [Candidatus Saccharimonadales bacterium]